MSASPSGRPGVSFRCRKDASPVVSARPAPGSRRRAPARGARNRRACRGARPARGPGARGRRSSSWTPSAVAAISDAAPVAGLRRSRVTRPRVDQRLDDPAHRRRLDLLGLGELGERQRPGKDDHRQGRQARRRKAAAVILAAERAQQPDRGRMEPRRDVPQFRLRPS